MLAEGGLRTKVRVETADPPIFLAKGNFEGLNITANSIKPDPGETMFSLYHDEGSRAGAPKGYIPASTLKLLEDQRSEIDGQKRQSMIREAQRQIGDVMTDIPGVGATKGFTIAWPWLLNGGVFNPWTAIGGALFEMERAFNYWVDTTKQKIS
jgi:ABC-type transport system substrate-binding protein